MNSRTVGSLISAPLMFVGVRLATKYIRHAPSGVRTAVVMVGGIGLGVTAPLMVAGIFVMVFPRLGARLFPWLAAAQRRARRAP